MKASKILHNVIFKGFAFALNRCLGIILRKMCFQRESDQRSVKEFQICLFEVAVLLLKGNVFLNVFCVKLYAVNRRLRKPKAAKHGERFLYLQERLTPFLLTQSRPVMLFGRFEVWVRLGYSLRLRIG